MKKPYVIISLFIASASFAMEQLNNQQVIKLLSEKNSTDIDWMFQQKLLSLETKDSQGNPLLHNIVEKGNPILLKKLGNRITSKAKKIKNSNGKTPDDIINDALLKSINSTPQNPEEFKKFQQCKEILDLNIGTFSDEIDTPQFGTVNSLEELLKNNIINFQLYNDEGDTYFHRICANAQVEILKVFIKYVPGDIYYKKNNYGSTPPQILQERMFRLDHSKDKKEMKKIIASYEKQQQYKKENETTIDTFIENEDLFNKAIKNKALSLSAKDSSGTTLLHRLAEGGRCDLIPIYKFSWRSLVSSTDLKQKNNDGRTPEQVAQHKFRQLAQEKTSEETLEKYLKTIQLLQQREEETEDDDDCTII